MPAIDKRNTVEHLHTGGSDVGLQVYLDADEAVQIYGADATAGWYTPFTFEGGTIAYAVDGEEDKDEAGQLTGKFIERSAEFTLSNTFKETSDEAEDLVDEVLAKGFHKYRYALPAGEKEFDDGAGGTVQKPVHKLYAVDRGKITPGFELPTSEGQKRVRALELKSSKYQGTPAFRRGTVDLADEDSWPAKFDNFKTAA